ncbi:MAG: HTH domain-containing protein [Candidatus Bathyarchaeia archaeon]
MTENLEQKILKCIEAEYPRDLSIEEISKKTGIHRNTVSKYIWGLERQGKVEVLRKVGRAKMYIAVKK